MAAPCIYQSIKQLIRSSAMEISSSTTLLLSSILLLSLLLLPSPSAANEGNILVTGDILRADEQLTEPNGAVFVIQNDCNLVLYNKGSGFQSDTSGRGSNCSLTLSEYGQLIIKNYNGDILWSSPSAGGGKGEYAAILKPDGQVGVYGPSLWFTFLAQSGNVNFVAAGDAGKLEEEIKTAPNLLFSSEVLNEEVEKLVSRDYALKVKRGCSLQFTKASAGVLWQSPANINGRNCFARLNFHGQLSLVDDSYRVLWETKPAAEEGVYVLAVKINGVATIYGRQFWST